MNGRVIRWGAVASLALLCACQPRNAESELIEQAKSEAAASLKDPDSAKFRNLVVYPDKKLVCGQINGKNSYGAYSGFTDFYYEHGFAMIAGHDSVFRSLLDERCLGAMKDQGDEALRRARAIWKEMPDSEEKRKAMAEIDELEKGER